MLKGLWKLTWVETKIFVREPMGVVGTLAIPVLLFVVLGRAFGSVRVGDQTTAQSPFNLGILAALMIAVNAVLSLVAIIAIYREGGILKRLRATPLSPLTILSAQVLVKLIFSVVSLALLVLAGRRLFPGAMNFPMASFSAALLLSTLSILSLGFLIASIIPTARFAQPIGAAILYPMVSVSGLFFPVSRLPPALQILSYGLPTTHAVSLMRGVWDGPGWSGHWWNAGALVVIFAVCSALATKLFRWE
ncbi:MAG: ABC transporter permease [Acidobacteriota bacterium]